MTPWLVSDTRADNRSKIRVGFLNTHPIQYFAPLYRYLNGCPDLAVTALYLSDYSVRGALDHGFGREVKWDVDLLSGYTVRFLNGADRRDEPRHFLSTIAPGLWKEIRRASIDALVVHGHWPAAQIIGVAAAKMCGIPVFMRAETHLGLRRRGLKARIRVPVLKRYYARMSGVLTIGSANAEFYRALNVPERRMFLTPYSVDNDRIMSAAQLTRSERPALRRSLGVHDDRPIVLYAAKFEPRKRPEDLLHAAAQLNAEGAVFQLVMVGSGALKQQLFDLARHLNVVNLHFAGFVNQSEMPRVYGASDLFVLPSENEPWGLVVNEAMCARLPIVASTELGCVPDLVRSGVNGWTFPAGDIAALTAALRILIFNPEMRRRMGAASQELISHWSYAEVAQGLRSALKSVGLRQMQSCQ